jgi:hypothetical protein
MLLFEVMTFLGSDGQTPFLNTLHTRDSATRFSTSGLFHESVSPKPLRIPLGPFKFFPKIHGDIHTDQDDTTGVIVTSGKWKNSQSEGFNFFVWTSLSIRVTYR